VSTTASIPEVLRQAARRWGPAIAMRHRKKLARWGILTWSEVLHQTDEVCAGLTDMGLQRGDRVAVFAATRAEWTIADYAVLTAGAVTVPVYHTSTTGQLTYIVNNCGARFLVVDNEARMAMALEARERMRSVQGIVVLDSLDLQGREGVISFTDVARAGRRYLRRNPEMPARAAASTKRSDDATIVYTSGATGMPKGVVLTHHNMLSSVQGITDAMPLTADDVTVGFLPLSHIYGRIGQLIPLLTGVSTAYAQRIDRLEEVLVEVKPTYILGVPLVYERIYRALVQRFRELSPLRKVLLQRGLSDGLARVRSPSDGRERLRQRLLDRVAERAVFSQVRESFGGRMRFAVSGGAPLHPSIAEFFRVIGIELLEGYGLTETAAAATLSRLEDNRLGSVGHPIPGMRIRVASSGEVLIRGDSVFRGYHELPEDTAEAFDGEGWFRSGDTGWIDSEGRLLLTGRVKDLIITSGAKNVAPQYVETTLKLSPWIKEALVYGDRRRYVVALVDLGQERAVKIAGELGLDPATDHEQLATHPRVVERVAREVEIANRRLAPYEQVRQFAILPRPLSIAGGALSHSMKLRREKVAQQYDGLIDSLYEGEVPAEATR
jgi:long-chain acyl-CoA synthetase